jgi:hypothetical protein
MGAIGDKPRGVVQEVRTLEFLLNDGLERSSDRADVGE